MRQIGNLPDMEQALTLADYLLSLQIETRLEHEPTGSWAVWVCDEDRMPQARDELAAFQKAPNDARFVEVAQAERARRQAPLPDEEDEEPEIPDQSAVATPGLRPVTLIVVLITVTLGLVTLPRTDSFLDRVTELPPELRLTVSNNDPTLPEVCHGQIWRLVTPALVHVSMIHWFFNLLWFLELGGQVEARRGSGRLLLLILVLSVLSNLAQFYLGHPVIQNGQLQLDLSSRFAGLSGVVYGLLGFVWIKERFEPRLGFTIPPTLTILLVAWLLISFTGLAETLIGPVAHAAQVAGLVAGVVIGAAPIGWRAVRKRG